VEPQSNQPEGFHLQLTDEQRAKIVEWVAQTGDANLAVDVIFEADMDAHVLAPSTFLVGTAT
jgi:hypothetical protein